ncbi:MAG: ornithine--oxo-acid transaminase [Gemmatimonadales bacterium]|nr:ornithine--oxo-acid transaminase [Gemmatimonadales bacterium]
MTAVSTSKTGEFIALEERYGTNNYHPLPIVVERGEGAWVYDVEGRRFLDCLSSYSAVNLGHGHPRLIETLTEQAARVTLTSRAFRNDQLAYFVKELAELAGLDKVLPMNTGAEAVETAIKAARRWGYRRKGIAKDRAKIIVCEGNFHGRTTTIVGFSSEESYRDDFGPFAPGFVRIPFGDLDALAAAIDDDTCGFLVEPIQCESGIHIPPDGYLRAAAELCRTRNVLFMADEIQTGLGRTGKRWACDHEGVTPDLLIVGKALSGGAYPVSAVIGRDEVMDLFNPGSHGSTYGGNPLGCAVARTAMAILEDEDLAGRSARLGAKVLAALKTIKHPHIREVRGRGLLIGIELTVPARPYCERLAELGLLCKETHDLVVRLTPPLVVAEEDLDWMIAQVKSVFSA